jgi:hypothetical protein
VGFLCATRRHPEARSQSTKEEANLVGGCCDKEKMSTQKVMAAGAVPVWDKPRAAPEHQPWVSNFHQYLRSTVAAVDSSIDVTTVDIAIENRITIPTFQPQTLCLTDRRLRYRCFLFAIGF